MHRILPDVPHVTCLISTFVLLVGRFGRVRPAFPRELCTQVINLLDLKFALVIRSNVVDICMPLPSPNPFNTYLLIQFNIAIRAANYSLQPFTASLQRVKGLCNYM
jgi:hypothetical protein